jgi:hypothetical protein
MISNTTGIRENLVKMGMNKSHLCRHCHIHPETQAHVLGLSNTKPKRIKGHNDVVNYIKERMVNSNYMNTVYHEETSVLMHRRGFIQTSWY